MEKGPSSITLAAPAKVNFFLKVTGKRPDGYHELVSVMQALELADEITVAKTPDGITVSCDDPAVPSGEKNIAYRAAAALIEEAGIKGGVAIGIKKRVPMAAGLGGGSSDAAAVLKGMDVLFGLGLGGERLMGIGLRLGADVPFFLFRPSALAKGVGERLTGLPTPRGVWLVLVNPGFPVSTAWVYANLKFGLTNMANSIRLPAFKGPAYDAGLLVSYLHNDLERVTAGRHPQITDISEMLVGLGAKGALMSGSGPTVFGVFEDLQVARNAASRLTRPGHRVLVTRPIARWPEYACQAQ